jgi:hypothetical protein
MEESGLVAEIEAKIDLEPGGLG